MLTDEQINAAAQKLAECMDYPWEHMPKKGRQEMRAHAVTVIEAAHRINKGESQDEALIRQRLEALAESFEAMHGRGDVWITTIAAAKLARAAQKGGL